MSSPGPAAIFRHRRPGILAFWVSAVLLAALSPAAWSLTVSSTSSTCSAPDTCIKQGDSFDIDTSGGSFTAGGGTQALIWGSGPFLGANLTVTSGSARDVALSTATVSGETFAFVADGSASSGGGGGVLGGLQIINVTSPDSPSKIGSYLTPGPAMGVAVSGDGSRVYVAEGSGGVDVVSVANPSAPGQLRHFNVSGPATDIALGPNGNYAYVAVDGANGLSVINLSTFAVSAVPTKGGAQGVTVYGSANLAYVAEGSAGMEVFDISNPAAPAVLGRVPTAAFALKVAIPLSGGQCVQVSGECYVYVADREGGLVVVDVTSSSAPKIVGSAPTLSQARGVFVSPADGLAYVADYAGGLEIFDISDPAAPQPPLNFTLPLPWSISKTVPMVVTHGLAESVVVGQATVGGQTRTYAYLAASAEGLQVVDVTGAARASPMFSSVSLGGGPGDAARGVATNVDVVTNGSGVCAPVPAAGPCYAYVAAGDTLRPVNLTSRSPATPVAMPDLALGVAVAKTGTKTYAYVADRYKGLQTVDVTGGAPPVGTVPAGADTPGVAANVDIVTDSSGVCVPVPATGHCYAYVADMQGGLQVMDISQPDAPQVVASVPMAAAAVIPASGQLAQPVRSVRAVQSSADPNIYIVFAASGTAGLDVLEVNYSSSPVQATILAREQLPSGSAPIQVLGTAADVAVPRNNDGTCNTATTGGSCYAFVADGKFGLEVFDVTRNLLPEAVIPNPVALANVPGDAKNVVLSGVVSGVASGTFAYVTYLDGIEVFDIAKPLAPIDVGSVNTPDYVHAIAMAGKLLYMADAAGGVAIVPTAVYSPTSYPGSGSVVTATATTNLPGGVYNVTVVNPDGTKAIGHNVLTLTSSASVAALQVQGAAPVNTVSTAQSAGGGNQVAAGPDGQASVGQVRSPSQVDMGGGGGGSGGGGALGAGLLAVLLMARWGRIRFPRG